MNIHIYVLDRNLGYCCINIVCVAKTHPIKCYGCDLVVHAVSDKEKDRKDFYLLSDYIHNCKHQVAGYLAEWVKYVR